MLSALRMVGEWLAEEESSAWDFEEIRLDAETRDILAFLDQNSRQIDVSDYSAKVVLTGSSGNHCYIPSQYFLYALKLRPLLALISKYREVLTELSREGQNEQRSYTISVLRTEDATSAAIGRLDTYSRDNFFRIFTEDNAERLGAKAFIKSESEHRSIPDFFSSILLAATPVPNASSGMLADLLLLMAGNQPVLMHLQRLYGHAIPWLFCCADGDEIVFRVMCTLGWEGKLDQLQDTEPASWGEITDAFLLRPTPVPGNAGYIETPVHFLEDIRKYVFVRKGLLDAATFHQVSGMIGELWPGMCVRSRGNLVFVEAESRHVTSGSAVTGGINRILYGAPGTGKSHRLLSIESKGSERFITVFHPDTQYADFVGALKPVTQGDNVVTYQFRPGPFTRALVFALRYPERKVSLIIEEINRASAAAVFGELFQLLDRDPNGKSTYEIHAGDPDMLGYINTELGCGSRAPVERLWIPSNLSILATMNSSDQAVMPLDTAFRRRWRFEYLPIDFDTPDIPQTRIELCTRKGIFTVPWPAFARIINDCLIECDVPEDRLIGPFFLGIRELENAENRQSVLGGKLFIYLWDDVLRHRGHERMFAPAYKTFGELSSAFRAMKPVFSTAMEERLEQVGTPVTEIQEPTDAAG